jgi:hypothetical protein
MNVAFNSIVRSSLSTDFLQPGCNQGIDRGWSALGRNYLGKEMPVASCAVSTCHAPLSAAFPPDKPCPGIANQLKFFDFEVMAPGKYLNIRRCTNTAKFG